MEITRTKWTKNQKSREHLLGDLGAFVDCGNELMIGLHLRGESWKHMEHSDGVNIFSVQVDGGREMRDEAGKGVEMIGRYMDQKHSSAVNYSLWQKGAIEAFSIGDIIPFTHIVFDISLTIFPDESCS